MKEENKYPLSWHIFSALVFIFLCGLVTLLFVGKGGPYYYGHCDNCWQTWKVSSWTLPGQNVDTLCPKCKEGYVHFPPIGSEEWKEEKRGFRE